MKKVNFIIALLFIGCIVLAVALFTEKGREIVERDIFRTPRVGLEKADDEVDYPEFESKEDGYSSVDVDELMRNPYVSKFPHNVTLIRQSIDEVNAYYNSLKIEAGNITSEQLDDLLKKVDGLILNLAELADKILRTSRNKILAIEGIERAYGFAYESIVRAKDQKFVDAICLYCGIATASKSIEEKMELFENQLKHFETRFNEKLLEKPEDLNLLVADALDVYYFTETGLNGTGRNSLAMDIQLEEKVFNYLRQIAITYSKNVNTLVEEYANRALRSELDEESLKLKTQQLARDFFEKYNLNRYRYYDFEKISYLRENEILADLQKIGSKEIVDSLHEVRNMVSLLIHLNSDYRMRGYLEKELGDEVVTLLSLSLLI